MYVCNWAPRLALRGPAGSLSRAFEATRSEKKQINLTFTIGVLAFALQMVAAVWVMDQKPFLTPHALYTTIITGVLLVIDVYYHCQIHKRFFGVNNEWGSGQPNRQGPRRNRLPRAATSASLEAPLLVDRGMEPQVLVPQIDDQQVPVGSAPLAPRAASDVPASPRPLAEVSEQRQSDGVRTGRRASVLNNPLARASAPALVPTLAPASQPIAHCRPVAHQRYLHRQACLPPVRRLVSIRTRLTARSVVRPPTWIVKQR